MSRWTDLSRIGLAVVLLAPTLLSACSLIPCAERRHESGLLLVCPEEFRDMPEELKGAASFAWWLAEDHPDELGFPWPNQETGTLELRVTGPSGEAVGREWMAGQVQRIGPKPHGIPPPQVPVTFTLVDRSFRQLTDIQHGVVPPKDLPDGDAIYMTGPDARRNATVITIDRLSDRLLQALAARYGTSAIVIRVDPFRPRISY